MAPRDDPSPTGHLAAARTALENEDLAGAVRHVASALSEDPNRSEALTLLDEVLAASDDSLQLLPDDDLPASSGMKAVHAYILADQGRLPEAVEMLLGVITDRPDVLYIDWVLGWLQRPEAAGRLDMDKLVGFVGALVEQFPALTAPHSGARDTLARMPLFIQLVRRTQPADSHFLAVSVALLRRLGNLDEALKLAREAYAQEPDLQTTLALAGAHASRDELDEALQVYRDALERDPTDVTARINMADLLVHRGELPEAQELFAEILEREPEHEAARPSYYYLRFVTGAGGTWRDQLLTLAEEQPDNERAKWLAQRLTPYLGYLPDPPDLISRLDRPANSSDSTLSLSVLEAPSNYLAFDWLGKREVHVARVQKPDPRLPRSRVDYLLWTYDGTRPSVAVASPAPRVRNAVAELASQPYRLDAWWGQARRLVQQLGLTEADDVLATMVHPPGVAHVDQPAAWVYRVQIASALVLAHLDGGWEDSLRRSALLALANGPMDWTVDAALVALAALARDEEDAAPEIVRLFRELRKQTPVDGTICYYPALLWCSLRLPDLPDEERADLRQRIRRWETTREAERHYRQALAHAGKGEFDLAVTELTETLRLDPESADAFQERAALALRRGDARQALEDFTRALELRPGTAAVHLGRGQAQLRLGRSDHALADFTAAADLAPWDWQPWYRRGLAHVARKEHEQAAAAFTEVVHLAPEQPEGYLQRALAYTQLGRLDRAIDDYTEQIRLNPASPLAYNFRARLHYRQGSHAAAVADHLRAIELDPANANTHSQLAWIWATCPDAAIRDGGRAVAAAQKACELTEWQKAHCLDALAAAHAENGRFDDAVRWAERAVELAREGERPAYQQRLDAYRQRQPWRDRSPT
jgi:tetratricopeptide (TPR) repeat protein